jgi:hypothetical protein
MISRILSFVGWFAAAFMTLSASLFTWLVPLLKIKFHTYLLGCTVVSLALADWLEFIGSDEDDRF